MTKVASSKERVKVLDLFRANVLFGFYPDMIVVLF